MYFLSLLEEGWGLRMGVQHVMVSGNKNEVKEFQMKIGFESCQNLYLFILDSGLGSKAQEEFGLRSWLKFCLCYWLAKHMVQQTLHKPRSIPIAASTRW